MKKDIFYNNKSVAKKLGIEELSTLGNVDKKINVDINKLLNRVKIDQQAETKKKFIFFSFGIFLLAVMGTSVSIVR